MGYGDTLTSPGMTANLVVSYDGNLLIYGANPWEPLWQTFTGGIGTGAHMQPDGDFVVYDLEGKPIWSSGTRGNPGALLTIEDDGELVIVGRDGRALWTSIGSEGWPWNRPKSL
jgi:hypothetical protein